MSNETQQSRFNWGTGLTIVIVLFVCTTLSIVAFLVSLDYEMVTEKHYKKATNYQQHIERVEHTAALSNPVEIELLQENNVVEVRFPAEIAKANPQGTIELYRPSDSSLDQKIALAVDEAGKQRISTANLAKGKWLVKVSWTADSTSYFKEENIFYKKF